MDHLTECELSGSCEVSGYLGRIISGERSATRTGADRTADAQDSGDTTLQGNTDTSLVSLPVFATENLTSLNKARIYRTDAGGLMALGRWEMEVSSTRLAYALGIGVGQSRSYHLRENPSKVFHNDFRVVRTGAEMGHTLVSISVVNMHHDEDVYIHCSECSSELIRTSADSGRAGASNAIAVVPLGSRFSDTLYVPPVPLTLNVGKSSLASMRISLCNAAGEVLNFRGGDHSLTIRYTVEPAATMRDQVLSSIATMPGYHRASNPTNRFPLQ
jgi:hypothetical protein